MLLERLVRREAVGRLSVPSCKRGPPNDDDVRLGVAGDSKYGAQIFVSDSNERCLVFEELRRSEYIDTLREVHGPHPTFWNTYRVGDKTR